MQINIIYNTNKIMISLPLMLSIILLFSAFLCRILFVTITVHIQMLPYAFSY